MLLQISAGLKIILSQDVQLARHNVDFDKNADGLEKEEGLIDAVEDLPDLGGREVENRRVTLPKDVTAEMEDVSQAPNTSDDMESIMYFPTIRHSTRVSRPPDRFVASLVV